MNCMRCTTRQAYIGAKTPRGRTVWLCQMCAGEVLDEMADLLSEYSCANCPRGDYDETGTFFCRLPDDGQRPCEIGWVTWVASRLESAGSG